MKIKYNGTDPNMDNSINLVDELVKEGIITDRESQIVGIYDNEILLTDINPSEQLVDIVNRYGGYKINTAPEETDPFKPEDGLPDVSKIGAVPDLTTQVEDDPQNGELNFSLSEIELFPETELGSGNVDKNNSNFSQEIMNKNRKNFNDPTLDPNGVAKECQQAEVESTAKKDDANYTPAEGSLSSVDVEPFSKEDIEKANDVEVEMQGNQEVKVFSEQEIEEMDDPEDVEKVAEEMEEEQKTFSARQKRLFSAKRRLSRINRKVSDRKAFAEELSEKETSDVIEDIVAILNDAPEIRAAVAEEVEDLVLDHNEETVVEQPTEEIVETPMVEEEVETASEEPVEETPVEDTETVVEPEGEVTEFSDDEIDSAIESNLDAIIDGDTDSEENSGEESTPEIEETVAEETIESDETEEDNSEEEYNSNEAGEIFCRAFSEDGVANYRRQVLAEMAKHTPKGAPRVR